MRNNARQHVRSRGRRGLLVAYPGPERVFGAEGWKVWSLRTCRAWSSSSAR